MLTVVNQKRPFQVIEHLAPFKIGGRFLLNCFKKVKPFNLKFPTNNTSLPGDAVSYICDVSTVS